MKELDTVSNLHFHLTRNNMLAPKSLTAKASLHACSPSLDQQQPSCVPQLARALPEVFIQILALSLLSWQLLRYRYGTGHASCYSAKLFPVNLSSGPCDQPLSITWWFKKPNQTQNLNCLQQQNIESTWTGLKTAQPHRHIPCHNTCIYMRTPTDSVGPSPISWVVLERSGSSLVISTNTVRVPFGKLICAHDSVRLM